MHGPEAKAKALVAADRQKAKRKEKRAAKRWKLDSVKKKFAAPEMPQKGTWTAARGRPSRPQINGKVGTPRITKKVSSKGVVHKVLGLGG